MVGSLVECFVIIVKAVAKTYPGQLIAFLSDVTNAAPKNSSQMKENDIIGVFTVSFGVYFT